MFSGIQVLLARHKESTKYYAVKVLQKKIILKKKEVGPLWRHELQLNFFLLMYREFKLSSSSSPAKAYHGWAQRADEEHQASLLGGAALLLPDYWQAVLCAGLRKRWRGKAHPSPRSEENQARTTNKSKYVLCRCWQMFFLSPAVLPSPEREDLPGAQSQVLRCWNCKCTWLPPLSAHCVQVMSEPTAPPSGQMWTWPRGEA